MVRANVRANEKNVTRETIDSYENEKNGAVIAVDMLWTK